MQQCSGGQRTPPRQHPAKDLKRLVLPTCWRTRRECVKGRYRVDARGQLVSTGRQNVQAGGGGGSAGGGAGKLRRARGRRLEGGPLDEFDGRHVVARGAPPEQA